MKFRNRLLTSYLALILVPLIVLGMVFYQISLRIIREQAQTHFHEIVRKNNAVLDTKLIQIDHASRSMSVDPELFRIFEQLDYRETDQLLDAERKIRVILNKYFPSNDEVFQPQLWTTYFNFGAGLRGLTNTDPALSSIYRATTEKGGSIVWSPTFDFATMFNQPWLADAQIEYKYMFSATRLLNLSYLDSSTLHYLSPKTERPVLAILFQADVFSTLFASSIPEGAEFLIMDPSGLIVAHSDAARVTGRISEEWALPLLAPGTESGARTTVQDGQRMLVIYDRSEVTGWLSVVVVPQALLIRNLMSSLLASILLFAAVLGVVAVILAFVTSAQIIVPMKKLLVAMRYVGDGDFHTRVEATTHDEFGILLQKFNTMNNRIERLVVENYAIKLKEKEAEIMALNMQMNPHFLYNTLNVINWMAMEDGQKEVSKSLISLSSMLHYTTRKDWNEVPLPEELEWMKHYFYIMLLRFEDKFTVSYDLAPELFTSRVPRLLFQPFVENAILHGFDQVEQGGIIRITGRMMGELRHFTIADNGKGMDAQFAAMLLAGESPSVGFRNTLHRLQMQYGREARIEIDTAPGEGCAIHLFLPAKPQA